MTKQSQKSKIALSDSNTYSRDQIRKMFKKGVYHLTKLVTYNTLKGQRWSVFGHRSKPPVRKSWSLIRPIHLLDIKTETKPLILK